MIATGVDFQLEGESYQCTAKREVILSAGTIHSPATLERSGVGSPQVLEKLGIPSLVYNSGVGENLQDHVLTQLVYTVTDDKYARDNVLNFPEIGRAAEVEYAKQGTGLFSSQLNRSTFISWAQVTEELPEESAMKHIPEKSGLAKQYQIQLAHLHDDKVPIYQSFTGSSLGITMLLGDLAMPGFSYIPLVTSIASPFSRGSIHINSSSTEQSPVIDPHYLEHPLDLAILIAGLRYSARCAATAPLSGAFGDTIIPQKVLATDSEFENHVRQTLTTVYHPVGTCEMLPREDNGVVDSNLIVYGTKNLRVVDASIIPLLPSGNIQWTIYAVAERAADIIRASYSKS